MSDNALERGRRSRRTDEPGSEIVPNTQPSNPLDNNDLQRSEIDGRPFSWDQVGRMLMSFEGFTLRAFVDDSIEVIGGPLLEREEDA